MKPLLKSLFFLFLGIVVMLFGCQKEDTGCHDPQLVNWYNQSNLWMLGNFKIGDSVKFNVYRKDKANERKYIFLTNESFIVSDTSTKKQNDPNPDTQINCNDEVTNNYKVLNFKGPENLQSQLDATALTSLDIYLKGKDFGIGSIQLTNHQAGWLSTVNIGGNQFNNVKFFKGYAQGSGINYASTYVDSTYCFYNLQYGMLKFIVNDTLIYIRKLI